jgi:beta-lactamase regulating signal transducer with metallopeptidase domain
MGWIPIGWMAGVVLANLGLARSLLTVRRIWREAVPVADGELRGALSDSLARMDSEMRVELRATRDVTSPAATWGRPGRILLPAGLAELLSPTELRAVFAHELAHLRGRDPSAGLAQAVACGAFFFNPFVLALSRVIDHEREALRDAQAAERIGSPRRYGETLLTLAGFQASGARAGVVGLMGEGDLTHRIRRLGDRARTARRAGMRKLLAGSLTIVIFALLVATAATAGTLSSWAVMVDADDVAAGPSSTSIH